MLRDLRSQVASGGAAILIDIQRLSPRNLFGVGALTLGVCLVVMVMQTAAAADGGESRAAPLDPTIRSHVKETIREGRQTFRYATFGDESWWGGMLELHQAIEGSSLGGVGPGISPNTATLAVVVAHYDACMNLGLSEQQQSDLVEYLKSL
jgi:hypothetical protein